MQVKQAARRLHTYNSHPSKHKQAQEHGHDSMCSMQALLHTSLHDSSAASGLVKLQGSNHKHTRFLQRPEASTPYL